MVIYAPLSLVLSTLHKRSRKLKQSQGSQLGVWVRGYEGHKLAGSVVIGAKMADRSFADRVVLPVTAAIIQMAKKNQRCVKCVGPLKWESGAKLTRCCLI